MINKVTYVMNGFENIPITDTRVYDTNNIMNGVVDILKVCKAVRKTILKIV